METPKNPNTPASKPEEHYYDGIVEKNNPLPRWWLYLFYLTMLFAAVYYGYYQLGGGPTLRQEYEANMKAHDALGGGEKATTALPAEQLEALAKDPKALEAGKQIFATRCVVCHGPQGQGMIGPNLTDNFWIHGDGKMPGILKVVQEGVVAKGMPPWTPILNNQEIQQVAAFVRSIRGTKPPNPKAPQGEEYLN